MTKVFSHLQGNCIDDRDLFYAFSANVAGGVPAKHRGNKNMLVEYILSRAMKGSSVDHMDLSFKNLTDSEAPFGESSLTQLQSFVEVLEFIFQRSGTVYTPLMARNIYFGLDPTTQGDVDRVLFSLNGGNSGHDLGPDLITKMSFTDMIALLRRVHSIHKPAALPPATSVNLATMAPTVECPDCKGPYPTVRAHPPDKQHCPKVRRAQERIDQKQAKRQDRPPSSGRTSRPDNRPDNRGNSRGGRGGYGGRSRGGGQFRGRGRDEPRTDDRRDGRRNRGDGSGGDKYSRPRPEPSSAPTAARRPRDVRDNGMDDEFADRHRTNVEECRAFAAGHCMRGRSCNYYHRPSGQ
jgi:hypothetical protein